MVTLYECTAGSSIIISRIIKNIQYKSKGEVLDIFLFRCQKKYLTPMVLLCILTSVKKKTLQVVLL